MTDSDEHVSFSFRSKFGRDLAWNAAGFGVLGVSGIVVNVVIGRCFGASALGVFNQVFALYIFFSQLAVFGVHFSALKHVSQFHYDSAKVSAIVGAALFLAVCSATAWCVAGFFAADLLGSLFESDGLVVGWRLVIPGLWCFALNKVLLSVVNGLRHMRLFAVAQASRYVLMVVALVVCAVLQVDGNALAVVITVAECLLFLVLLSYVMFHVRPVTGNAAGWLRPHIVFGAKSFLSGTMISLNSRVDIIMLGLFLSDSRVGVYSMAALVVEGIAQLTVVFRSNVNPLLARYLAGGELAGLKQAVGKTLRTFYPVMIGVCIIAALVYPLFLNFAVGGKAFNDSVLVLVILLAGLACCAGYMPFNMILLQGGRPGWHTIYMTATVAGNVGLNAIMIPLMGIFGAAGATAASFVLSIVYLRVLARKQLSFAL